MFKLNESIFIFFVSLLVMSGCKKLENTIEIDLEAGPNELVVECYIEAGQPFHLLLTETKDYLDIVNLCPFVRNAIVLIRHNGVTDTLKEAPYTGSGCSSILPYFNLDSTRFFNYGTGVICPFDYNSDFVLEVWDTINDRYVTAVTKLIEPAPISNFQVVFDGTEQNGDSVAYCILGCVENSNTLDYYRMTVHKSSLFTEDNNSLFKYIATNPYFDQVMYDQAIFSGPEVLHVSGYDFYRTDTVIGTIYHIDKAYYDYLLTSRNAEQANLNPFIEPSGVLSNVQGGHGIFTFLSFGRDTLYIPW
jgi:hypothetical protein